MPAMHYTLTWPDQSQTVAYSPSLVIQDHFEVGASYPLVEFHRKLLAATATANERVQAKFGFVCSRANDQLAVLEAQLRKFAAHPDPMVKVVAFGPAD